MKTKLQPGQDVFIVTRSRTIAGQPPLKGTVSRFFENEGEVFAVNVKVDAREPQPFPPSEVFDSAINAKCAQLAMLDDAQHRLLITISKQRNRLINAKAKANLVPALNV